jgi:NAD(P)-dependent dehydrogenase (short-subunit alcohol dehydrogenase family)
MEKKTCVITGATSGIGYAIAKGLAARDFHVVLIGRDPRKGQSVINNIRQLTGSHSLSYYNVDLCSQRDIRRMANTIREQHSRIDALINNAGVWTSRCELTDDNIEKQFAVNHLAYFLLTHLLYANVARAGDGRVINMGSDSHKYGRIHFGDLNLRESYHGLKAYGQSKLANLLFTYELHRRKKEDHVSVYCVQPGLVKTDIGVKHTNPFHAFMWKLRRLGGISPEQAAETAIYLATSPDAARKSGLYWDRSKPKISSALSRDEETATRLWKISEEMCGITDYFPMPCTP